MYTDIRFAEKDDALLQVVIRELDTFLQVAGREAALMNQVPTQAASREAGQQLAIQQGYAQAQQRLLQGRNEQMQAQMSLDGYRRVIDAHKQESILMQRALQDAQAKIASHGAEMAALRAQN